MELEEGECSCSGDEEREGEQVGEGERCNNEENGAVLSAIQQKLQKDVSWPSNHSHSKLCHATRDKKEEETEDRVAVEKLEQLAHCDVIRGMLTNPHLRQLLLELDGSPAPQQALRRAMNIPVFIEFSNQCLRLCGLRDNEEKL